VYPIAGAAKSRLRKPVRGGMRRLRITGLWFGTASVAIGVVITASALIGIFSIGEAFPLWMAFVNGGGLILGGLRMRRT